MIFQPICLHGIEDLASLSGDTDWVNTLFCMGAVSVDLGLCGDRIEVVVPAASKVPEEWVIRNMVAMMSEERYEALGEPHQYDWEDSWRKEVEGSLDFDGQTVVFEFSSCFVDTNFEDGTAGNLDMMVRTSPALPAVELDNLCLALPGFDKLVESASHSGQTADGTVAMGFGLAGSRLGFDDDVREAIKSIQEVDIFWGNSRERKLATVPCERS